MTSDALHASQQSMKPIRVKLFFSIPVSEEERSLNRDVPMKLVTVKLPKGLPVYRVRSFVKHIEKELLQTYGASKRVNFCFVSEERGPWTYDHDIPTLGVVYT